MVRGHFPMVTFHGNPMVVRFFLEKKYVSNSMMKHSQKSDWKSDLSWFSCGCLLVSCLYIYIGPPNWVQYWVRVVNNSWRCSPISFKHVYLWCLLVGPHWTTYQSNLGVRLKKWATYEPLTSWMSEWVPFRNYTLRIQICSLYIFLIYVGCYFIVTHTHCKNVQWRVHPLDIKISSDQDYVLLL